MVMELPAKKPPKRIYPIWSARIPIETKQKMSQLGEHNWNVSKMLQSLIVDAVDRAYAEKIGKKAG